MFIYVNNNQNKLLSFYFMSFQRVLFDFILIKYFLINILSNNIFFGDSSRIDLSIGGTLDQYFYPPPYHITNG